MKIAPGTNTGIFRTQENKRSFINKARFIFDPVISEAGKFIKEKPIVATGGGLTFLGFLTSLFIKDGIKYFPIIGIPVIGAFIHEIFNGKSDTGQIDQVNLDKYAPVLSSMQKAA